MFNIYDETKIGLERKKFQNIRNIYDEKKEKGKGKSCLFLIIYISW